MSRSSGTKVIVPVAVSPPALMRTCTGRGSIGASNHISARPSTAFTWMPGTVLSRSVAAGPNSSLAAPGICQRPPSDFTVNRVSPATG